MSKTTTRGAIIAKTKKKRAPRPSTVERLTVDATNFKSAEAAQRLIEAAPALLTALKFCRSVLRSHGLIDLSEKIADGKATAAIVRAEGKATDAIARAEGGCLLTIPMIWRDGKPGDAIVTDREHASDPECHAETLAYYGGHLVAESVGSKDKTLIKAAPAMLAALEFVQKFVAFRARKGEAFPSQFTECVDAAIALAKGGAA